ncbi:MAG: Unknown protein [uncultured Sulfurovum sp.]|uniref:DUF5050 domain-containing protein n=1 Tax=uncultured Sulfurovum sp. TaxID=269237 RepID=A0A6S6S360_9BACT|nr:MAG: Unknown protein [uncultured Sulfurovum sp.]
MRYYTLISYRNTMSFKSILYAPLTLTVFACSNSTSNHTIATIPEASGISYCHNTQTLVVANDEGIYYELTPEGKILTKQKLGKYDLEGVVCHDKHYLFAVENGSLLKVDRSTQNIQSYKIKGKKISFSKKSGIEGISFHKGHYYLSIQSKKKQSKMLVVSLGENYAKVIDIIKHNSVDIAGLQFHDKKLYMVSDKKDKLYVYSLKQNKVLKKVKLSKFAQEGITFDDKHYVYFADDDGSVKKYTTQELGFRL